MKDQHNLGDELQMVEDSIHELSKRVYQIQGFVTQQLADIDKNQTQAVASLEQRNPLQQPATSNM